MILVFDLDDTLFDELSYVRSGFRVVADFIESKHGIPGSQVFSMFDIQLQKGRSNIFDVVFRSLDMFSKSLVRKCVSLYRMHQPQIELYPEARVCLARFREYPLYIVTDGNKTAQKNKLMALGLYNTLPIRRSYLTWQYGLKHAKPSPYCFFKIAEREKVHPEKIAYIGDNPLKDFVGLKPIGFKTVRVCTGQHRNVKKAEQYEAEFAIQNLNELNNTFLKQLFW